MKLLLRVLMLVLAIGLLWYTIRHTDADILQALRTCAPIGIAAALICYGMVLLLGAWRWQILLAVQGMHFSLWLALRLTLVGGFFSMLIPGSVTGDVLKIAIASQRYPGRVAELTAVALIDRIVGLSGIFFAAMLSTLCCIPTLRVCLDSTSISSILIGIVLINLGCLGTILMYIIFLTRPRWSKWTIVTRLANAIPKRLAALLGKVDTAMELYRSHQRALLYTLLISILIHCGCAMTFFCLGKSLHESHMTPPQYALATQMANVTGIIPIAPGGVGLRDIVAATLYKQFDATPASVCGDLPIFNTMILLFWALVGALLYIFSPSLKQANQSQT